MSQYKMRRAIVHNSVDARRRSTRTPRSPLPDPLVPPSMRAGGGKNTTPFPLNNNHNNNQWTEINPSSDTADNLPQLTNQQQFQQYPQIQQLPQRRSPPFLQLAPQGGPPPPLPPQQFAPRQLPPPQEGSGSAFQFPPQQQQFIDPRQISVGSGYVAQQPFPTQQQYQVVGVPPTLNPSAR
jgi:hypothetical protein